MESYEILLLALAILAIIVAIEALPTEILLSPSRYADRLAKKALEGIVAQTELDKGLRDEARAILEAEDRIGWFDWIRHNQDQLPEDLLKTAKRAMKIKKFGTVFFLSVLGTLVILAIVFGENDAPKHTFEIWKR